MTNQTILNWVNQNKDKKSETEMKDELLKKEWRLKDINDAIDVAFGRKAPTPSTLPTVSQLTPARKTSYLAWAILIIVVIVIIAIVTSLSKEVGKEVEKPTPEIFKEEDTIPEVLEEEEIKAVVKLEDIINMSADKIKEQLGNPDIEEEDYPSPVYHHWYYEDYNGLYITLSFAPGENIPSSGSVEFLDEKIQDQNTMLRLTGIEIPTSEPTRESEFLGEIWKHWEPYKDYKWLIINIRTSKEASFTRSGISIMKYKEGEREEEEKRREQITEEIDATVTVSLETITITNNNSYSWPETTKVYLNPGIILSGYEYHLGALASNKSWTVSLFEFTKGAGERFNPYTIKVKQVHIWAGIGNHWYGSFK